MAIECTASSDPRAGSFHNFISPVLEPAEEYESYHKTIRHSSCMIEAGGRGKQVGE